MITIGQSSGPLKQPASGEHLTDDHLALIDRSWYTGKHDATFGGEKMYNVHVKVFGTPDALARIDYVVYLLDRSYPHPARLGGPPETNFQLKELANGYSLIRANVFVRGQVEPVQLSRFVDLTENCDRFADELPSNTRGAACGERLRGLDRAAAVIFPAPGAKLRTSKGRPIA